MKAVPFTLLLCCFYSTLLSAQPELSIPAWHFMDRATIPSPTADMPDYARLLYAEEVNVETLEAAFTAHYDRVGWEHQLTDLEQNPYAKFLHRWMQGAQAYIADDKTVHVMNTEQLLEWRATHQRIDRAFAQSQMGRGTGSIWSFVGPRRTIWRADDQAEQTVAPWQVNIYCLAAAPSNPSILYCGSETGGLYKSVDKGVSWQAFHDYNWGAAILSVAIHPTDPNTVYVATHTDIFKTTDGGSTWAISKTESGLSCNALAIHPDNTEIVLAASANGLYRTSDGGSNWTKVIDAHIDDVLFRPGDGNIAYALARTGSPDTYSFYKTLDGGVTFNVSMSGWETLYEHSGGRLTVSPAEPDYVYAILLTHDGTDNQRKPYLLKSTDQATNWTTAAIGVTGSLPMNNGQGYYDLDVAASHLNPEHLIVATTTAYRSTDGGQNWTAIGGYEGPFSIHPDIQEIVCIQDGTGQDTWITTDGGVNYSSDFYASTSNWEARIDGLDGTNFWGFAQGWNEDYIVGGRYHNGNTALHENYPAQEALRMGGAESVTGWAMHGRERHAAFDDIAEVILPKNIDERPEGSFLFTKHPQNYYYGDAYSRVMVDLEDFMTLYLGDDNAFWRSQDGGASWEATHQFGGKPYHFDISRADGDYIYLTSDDGFYRSTDRGESFTEVNLPSGLTDWHSQNLRVAAHSLDKETVWVLNQRSGANSAAGRIFQSTDGGNSWTDWTTPALVGRKWTALAHQAGTDGGVYIASDRGSAGILAAKVMYRDHHLPEWIDCSEGLPASANPIKLLPFYRDGKLRWGGNRGVWEVDFYEENWMPIAQPFVSGKKQICVRDTVEFDSYSIARGDASYSWEIAGASWTSNLNQREVQALFTTTGTYTATLIIVQDGQTVSKSIDIQITNECDPDPKPGLAMRLSGASTDYAATIDALDWTTNELTFSVWIKRNGNQEPYSGIIFMRNSGTAAGLNFRENNEIGFHWDNAQWWWNSGLVVPDQEWTHVAMVVEPTQTTLYLNGVPATNTTDNAAVHFDGVLNFGSDPNWPLRRFRGDMDEIMIYDRALSQDDIRELMHITPESGSGNGPIAYWQFNRTSGLITDRIGRYHAGLVGGAARVGSTAPVGPGVSARRTVLQGGTYDFGATNLSLSFPLEGTVFPNGELCATRLNIAPDRIPGAEITSSAYWIVHNYGQNSSFSELSSMRFSNIEISADQAAHPEQILLYKRASNADGDTWNEAIDQADLATASPNGSVTFSEGNGQTSFSQFIVSFDPIMVHTETLESYADQAVVYPNPLPQGSALQLKTTLSGPIDIQLYQADGVLVRRFRAVGNGELMLGDLPKGIYSYTLQSADWRKAGKLVVE